MQGPTSHLQAAEAILRWGPGVEKTNGFLNYKFVFLFFMVFLWFFGFLGLSLESQK